MSLSMRFPLNRDLLLVALISSVFAGQVHAAAGRVEFALGGATLSGPNGQQRTLSKGAEVNSGDVVRTTDGRVQVRMADGAYISLQPNSEFGIKDYKFEGKADGTESAFYSLLKGAMRTVTGLIGRVNRNRFQVATPTATVGIRGTGGLIQVLDDGSTLVQGTSGIWILANPAGSIDVPAGVSGVAPSDPNMPPRETGQAPTAGPAPLPLQEEYVQGNQTGPSGTTLITAPTTGILSSGSGYMAALAYTADTCGDFCLEPFLNRPTGVATFNASGQMTQFDVSGSEVYGLLSGGTHAEFGTDGIVAWGRWVGPASVPETSTLSGSETYVADRGFHYVVGLPTTTMPQTGSATYTLIGATSPTASTAPGTATTFAPGTFTGTLTVTDWSIGIIALDLRIEIPAAQLGYSISGDATINRSTSTFSGNFDTGTSGGISPTLPATSCVIGCTASVNGFFAGNSAERAGLSYQIQDTQSSQTTINVVGAAAFTNQ